jgi:hypothetical protein
VKEAKVMKQEAVQSLRNVLFAVVLFCLVSAASGATLYAANNGVNGPACGPSATPCRSIGRAIFNAVAGDTIQVRAGLYGDLNGNGVLGEPGEENLPGSCDCMVSVNKPLTVISTDGAAATVIDASTDEVGRNVLIITSGAEFGRPDHGFLVTNPGGPGDGIVVEGKDIKIRGNQVLRDTGTSSGTGIESLNNPNASNLIEQNQAIGWDRGIHVNDAGDKVSKNHVSRNGVGIAALGDGSVVGNVATANFHGIVLSGAASAVGNATYGNDNGFAASSSMTGVIQKNNIFGNLSCGLLNTGAPGLAATNNYWGAATGPGPNPADTVCNQNGGTTTTTPFATARFAINPGFEP